MLKVPGFRDGEEIYGAATTIVNDPFDASSVASVALSDEAGVAAAVASATTATAAMRNLPTYRRAEILRSVAAMMQAESKQITDLIVRCTGKTVTESRAEAERSPEIILWAAEEARRIEASCPTADALPAGENKLSLLLRVPVGVVASITPFNAPLNSICHKIAPAFAAGNTVVAKPDLRGAAVAMILARCFDRAGAPKGSINIIHGEGDVGRALVSDPRVNFIGFTGGLNAALEIQKLAGMRRTQFELGGNAATIVHGDADWKPAIPTLIRAAFGLSGQSCISLQRLLVHRSIFDDFAGTFVEKVKALKTGDPKKPDTDVGPVVAEVHAQRIGRWIDEAVADGAQRLVSGERNGTLMKPTVLVGSKPTSRVMCEEVFGPLVSIIPYNDISDAIAQVNSSRFGLQAGIYTKSLDVAVQAARELHIGGVVVNGPSRQRLDHLPYGGRGDSGLGREGPAYAIREMTEMKVVVLNM